MTKDHPIEQIYSRIEDALRNQYSIGFSPEPKGAVVQYHNFIVQTRDGYYSK